MTKMTCPYKDVQVPACYTCENDDVTICMRYSKRKCEEVIEFSRNAIEALKDKGEEVIAIAERYEEILDRYLEIHNERY